MSASAEPRRAAFQDLFASAAALSTRLGRRRPDPREWDGAARRALADFAREQPPRRRALALALLRAATHARRLVGIAVPRRRDPIRRPRTWKPRRVRVRRARTRATCSRDGPEPPGDRSPSPTENGGEP